MSIAEGAVIGQDERRKYLPTWNNCYPQTDCITKVWWCWQNPHLNPPFQNGQPISKPQNLRRSSPFYKSPEIRPLEPKRGSCKSSPPPPGHVPTNSKSDRETRYRRCNQSVEMARLHPAATYLIGTGCRDSHRTRDISIRRREETR